MEDDPVPGDMNDPRNRRRSLGAFFGGGAATNSPNPNSAVAGFPKTSDGSASPGPHPDSIGGGRRRSVMGGGADKNLSENKQMETDIMIRKASIDSSDGSRMMTGRRPAGVSSPQASTQSGPMSPGIYGPNGQLQEVVQSSGLVFSERGELHFVLSKPKILPLKGKVIQKMEERMKEEEEANAE